MLRHAKFDGNSPHNNKVTAIYTLGTLNIPLILFSMNIPLSSTSEIIFVPKISPVQEFSFTFIFRAFRVQFPQTFLSK